MVSVTRQPFSERTLCSSQLRSVEAAVKSRLSGTTGVARRAYSRSIEMPQNFILITGTYESSTAESSVTSGWFCTATSFSTAGHYGGLELIAALSLFNFKLDHVMAVKENGREQDAMLERKP